MQSREETQVSHYRSPGVPGYDAPHREGYPSNVEGVVTLRVIAGIAAIPSEEAAFGSNNVRLEWDPNSPYCSLGNADGAPAVTTVAIGSLFYVHAKFRTIFHNSGFTNYQLGWCVAFSVYGGGLQSFGAQSTYGPVVLPGQTAESIISSYFKPSFEMPNTPSLELVLKVWFGDKHAIYMGGNPPTPWT